MIQLSDKTNDKTEANDTETLLQKSIISHRRKSSTSQSQSYGSVDDKALISDIEIDYNDTIWKDMAIACGVESTQLDAKKIHYLKPLIDKKSQKWIPMGIISIIWIISSIVFLFFLF